MSKEEKQAVLEGTYALPPIADADERMQTVSDIEREAKQKSIELQHQERQKLYETQLAEEARTGASASPVLAGQADLHTVQPGVPLPAPILSRASSIPAPVSQDREVLAPDLTGGGILPEPEKGDVPVARLGSSERSRSPLSRAPAAGPMSWPVPEDQLPAAMPSDVHTAEELDETALRDSTMPSAIFTKTADGLSLKGTGSKNTTTQISKKELPAAVLLYKKLRQQFPQMQLEMLADEFRLQWDGIIGGLQSHRPASEISPHGDTATGDFRIMDAAPGALRRNPKLATLADPMPSTRELQGEPELARRAPDDAKSS